MVDHRVTARETPNLGLPLSRYAHRYHEQHRLAEGAAGPPLVRVHDLRHSFACRLRAAGVSAEDREVLLGHANHSMAGHYASADLGRLLEQANLILSRGGTQTLLRVADSIRGNTQCATSVPPREGGGSGFARQGDVSQGAARDPWISRSTAVPQQLGRLGFQCQVIEFWRARQDSNPRPPGS